jgi:hypothetical protein
MPITGPPEPFVAVDACAVAPAEGIAVDTTSSTASKILRTAATNEPWRRRSRAIAPVIASPFD